MVSLPVYLHKKNTNNVPVLRDRIFNVPVENIQLNFDCVLKILLGLDGGKSMRPNELNPLLFFKDYGQSFCNPIIINIPKLD